MQSSTYPGDILTSIKQCPTPLNTLFFSEFNQNILQNAIRQDMYNKHQVRIDKQNKDDLLAIMRVVFINNSAKPYADICAQVKLMNQMVMKTAMGQISTGVAKYFGYTNLVLGAWGCGVFRNDPEIVADAFAFNLGSKDFKDCFQTIVFPIYGDREGKLTDSFKRALL